MARQIAREDHVERGLIAILRCVEPCRTYEVRGLRPVLKEGKCMHLYFYEQHPVFGFMHLRLQTWFPFQVEICLNGREWLARQLDKVGLNYQPQRKRIPSLRFQIPHSIKTTVSGHRQLSRCLF